MSVTIRLSRIGRKNAPAFRIVVVPTRSKRDGKSLAILGHYNPSNNPVLFEYDKSELNAWVKKGATLTDAVKKLIEGKYTYTKYEPHKKKAEAAAQA